MNNESINKDYINFYKRFQSHVINYSDDFDEDNKIETHNIQLLSNKYNVLGYKREDLLRPDDNTNISPKDKKEKEEYINNIEEKVKKFIDTIDITSDDNNIKLTLDKIKVPKNIHYIEHERRVDTVIHDGQLKLFIALIEFITFYVNLKDSNTNHVIVYAGAALGTNINIVDTFLQKYKNLYWYLYDINIFDIDLYEKHLNSNGRVTLVNDFIDPEKCKILKKDIDKRFKGKKHKIYFISDIRIYPSDSSIILDNENQAEMARALEAHVSQLKFRIPYDLETYGEYSDTEKTNVYKYLKGILFIQAFAAVRTTETRLVVFKENLNTMVEYTPKNYEDKLYIFNRVYRALRYKYKNIKHEDISKLHKNFDSCHDCVLASRIYTAFIRHFNINPNNYLKSEDVYTEIKIRNDAIFNRNIEGYITGIFNKTVKDYKDYITGFLNYIKSRRYKNKYNHGNFDLPILRLKNNFDSLTKYGYSPDFKEIKKNHKSNLDILNNMKNQIFISKYSIASAVDGGGPNIIAGNTLIVCIKILKILLKLEIQ